LRRALKDTVDVKKPHFLKKQTQYFKKNW